MHVYRWLANVCCNSIRINCNSIHYYFFLTGRVGIYTNSTLIFILCKITYKELKQYKMLFLKVLISKRKIKAKYLIVWYFWSLIRAISLFYLISMIAWVETIFDLIYSSLWIRTLSIKRAEEVVNLEWSYSLYGVSSLPKAACDLFFEVVLLMSFLTFSGQQAINYTKEKLCTLP